MTAYTCNDQPQKSRQDELDTVFIHLASILKRLTHQTKYRWSREAHNLACASLILGIGEVVQVHRANCQQ